MEGVKPCYFEVTYLNLLSLHVEIGRHYQTLVCQFLGPCMDQIYISTGNFHATHENAQTNRAKPAAPVLSNTLGVMGASIKSTRNKQHLQNTRLLGKLKGSICFLQREHAMDHLF